MPQIDKNNIEILAPGGDPDSIKAAILAGADAVYLGLKKFNARKRAENIDNQQLADLINIAHSRNVKIYITMNILLTQQEIPEALEIVDELIYLGIDALIVQDAGLCYLLKKEFPDLEVHASTQMTTHNFLQIEFLKKLGVKQLNFSRELSADELKPLIKCSHNNEIKTEFFVHGAYCISCSGICYMSAAIAAQPGNRGACLQPCRRQYSTNEESEKDYLLSLKDNNALPHAEELIEAGADTLKIEGRIKGYNYVYEVTNTWRETVDKLFSSKSADFKRVEKVFNRDFSTGYFQGSVSDKMFITSPLDQSLKQIGIIENYTANTKQLFIDRKTDLKNGDRINIYTPENKFICGAIIKGSLKQNTFNIEIENQLKGKILKGQLVMFLSDQSQAEILKSNIDQLAPISDKLNVTVTGKINEPLRATFSSGNKKIEVISESVLAAAQNLGLNKETLIKQFGRLGETQFQLGDIDVSQLEDSLFIPVKELNNMRRYAVDKFVIVKPEFIFKKKEPGKVKRTKKLALLISDESEIEYFSNNFDGQIFFETTTYTKIEKLNRRINLWLPPFIVDKEIPYYQNLITELNPNLVVSENSGLGNWCGNNGQNWIAGPQLNSSNGYSFDTYKELANASGGFYSTEINKNQIKDFSVPDNFNTYYNVFGNVLLMTTRQCLFLKPNLCPFNKSKTDISCIKGCDNYTKYFDERNIPFHIVKSYGHINRIFNDALLFLPEAINDINAEYFLLDFRQFAFSKLTREQKLRITRFFQSTIDLKKLDQTELKSIKGIIGSVTRGNYQRGFE
ncbi:MAG: U32 family peptidase [Melioribacteraceae bacterium]|nr:U32 family peptidase [Melioribacteraceae bacterium]